MGLWDSVKDLFGSTGGQNQQNKKTFNQNQDLPAGKMRCHRCGGSGGFNCNYCNNSGDLEVNCSICGGSGQSQDNMGNYVQCFRCNGCGKEVLRHGCQNCNGTGQARCGLCNGTGQIQDSQNN